MDIIEIFMKDQIAAVVNGFIIVVFVFFLIERKTWSNEAPQLLTSLGILGTFVGILLALVGFKEGDIDGSIPKLLSGLRFAFSTSVMGIASSVLYKVIIQILNRRNFKMLAEIKEDVTPTDIHSSLEKINQSLIGLNGTTLYSQFVHLEEQIKEDNSQMTQALQEVAQSIGGDRDTSLLTQMGQLRNDIRDGNDRVVKSLDSFSEELARVSTETIIETLREVVKDFNQLIQEQFGENFKELNKAVTDLVGWMDSYKDHVEKYEDRIDKVTSSIELTQQAIEHIRKDTAAIPGLMDSLGDTINKIDVQITDLEERLQPFSEMRNEALEAFPAIKEGINNLTSKLRSALIQHGEDIAALYKVMAKNLEQSVTESSDAIIHQLNTQTERWDDLTKSNIQGMEAAHKAHDEASQNLTSVSLEHAHALKGASEAVSQQLQQAVGDISSTLEESFKSFDSNMQQEVTRVLEKMGSQLASLSNQFVSDYTPLTQQLQRLISVSKNDGR